MASLENFVERLERARKVGPDRWQACCPAHADRSPSLHITLGRDGRILVNCKAGCSAAEIVSALGISWRELFSDGSVAPRRPRDTTFERVLVAIAESDIGKGRRLSRQEIASLKNAKLVLQKESMSLQKGTSL